MRIGKEIKRDTQLIIISVIILTIVTLNVSYSAFFSVQSISTIQEISTGNLEVDINLNLTGSVLSGTEELFPSTFDEVSDEATGNYASLILTNTGTIDADFLVTLSYDFDTLASVLEAKNGCCYKEKSDEDLSTYMVSLEYLNVSILDTETNQLIDFNGEESGEITSVALSSLTPSAENNYVFPILRDVVEANVNGTQDYEKKYKVYIWLSDETPTSEIGKYVYLNLDVKCVAGNETITESVGSVG